MISIHKTFVQYNEFELVAGPFRFTEYGLLPQPAWGSLTPDRQTHTGTLTQSRLDHHGIDGRM